MSKDLGFHDPAPDDRGAGIYSGIGDVLRQARERRGVALPDVAAQLRISESYLAAIERGRFTQLPGRSYVLGFLRSYAGFLGLNADKVVAQYKIEADDDFARQQQLKFPTVRPEGRTPGLWLLPVVMILAAAGYLGWYGWKTDLVSFDDMVPEVPERLRADRPAAGTSDAAAPASGSAPGAAGGLDAREPDGSGEMRLAAPDASTPASAAGAAADATATGPAAEPAGTSPAPDGATGATAPGSTAAEAVPPASAPESAAESAAGAAAGTAPETDAETAADAAIPGEDSPAGEAPAQGGAVADADEPPPLPSDPEIAGTGEGAAASGDSAIAGTPLADAPVPEGRVFGATDARVVLRARADTWVQVEDAQRNLLLTRVLKAGDIYGAPNQDGLVLMTGNAGGLVVEVDGAAVPSLGPRGAVRRNVSLDPDRLLDGSQAIN